MKFKGQGKINICGFEYKKNIADSRRGGGPSTQKKPCIRACIKHIDLKNACVGVRHCSY